MKFITKALTSLLFALLLFYIILPAPSFPEPPPGSAQSGEEADSETPLRRAYFTDYTRNEVLNYYRKEFDKPTFPGVPFFSYFLNYPPENSQTLIRDQTRSTFLEEIVHPLRESLYVNGFEPKEAKDEVWYHGTHYRQKIIIRYAPSNFFIRFIVVAAAGIMGWMLLGEWVKTIKEKI